VDAFDDRHEAIAELERDGHSMLLRALDRDDGTPVLVRRLVRSRRFDVDVRAGLVAEAEYCARLACTRCPEAETVTLEDGELVLEYKGADGVELDRVLNALEASGRVLTPAAAVALVSEVLHNAEAIARIKPPAVEAEVWGHGEIAPRSVMLGRDGFGRLYEARLATSGFRSLSSPGSTLCRAPELAGGVLFGTPSSDVYAVGALVSLALFGQAPLAGASSEPLAVVLARAAVASPGVGTRRAAAGAAHGAGGLARGSVPRPRGPARGAAHGDAAGSGRLACDGGGPGLAGAHDGGRPTAGAGARAAVYGAPRAGAPQRSPRQHRRRSGGVRPRSGAHGLAGGGGAVAAERRAGSRRGGATRCPSVSRWCRVVCRARWPTPSICRSRRAISVR
jgi:hypothetical protein